jgi:hypothetical protein
MARISSGIFNKWLATYGLAWEDGDPQGAADLFAEEASYRVTPFDEPMVGQEAILEYWQAGPASNHKEVSFTYRIISVRGNEGIARWQANFRRADSNNFVELDGILIAEFDDSGTCTDFKEWWHRRETRPDDQED